jgi:hypothetical protein
MAISTSFCWRSWWAVVSLWALSLPSAARPSPTIADTVQPLAPDTLVLELVADSSCVRRSLYQAAHGVTWQYEQPRQFGWLVHIPRALGQFPGYTLRRKNVPALVSIAGSSAALWALDEPILRGVQQAGSFVGLSATDAQRTLVYLPLRMGRTKVPLEFNVPDNLNTSFYFLGDGWTHLAIATSFMTYGWLKHDNRAAQTASELGEAVLSTGLVVQVLKRITGRQSPFRATERRGEWRPLPTYSTYQSNVSNYDAFPSGHLATAMATVTVIAENYPEYHFIRPVGYSLMGVLGLAMLNNGVHWASDYPLGIALGYSFAKIAVRNGRTRVAPAGGTSWQPLRPASPWYRRGELAPFNYGPFIGASITWRW